MTIPNADHNDTSIITAISASNSRVDTNNDAFISQSSCVWDALSVDDFVLEQCVWIIVKELTIFESSALTL